MPAVYLENQVLHRRPRFQHHNLFVPHLMIMLKYYSHYKEGSQPKLQTTFLQQFKDY